VIGVSVVATARGTRLLGRRLYLARDGVDYIPASADTGCLTPEFVRDRALECHAEGLGYLACTATEVPIGSLFSGPDLASHDANTRPLQDLMRGQPVGALVFAAMRSPATSGSRMGHGPSLAYARILAQRLEVLPTRAARGRWRRRTTTPESPVTATAVWRSLQSKVAVIGAGARVRSPSSTWHASASATVGD